MSQTVRSSIFRPLHSWETRLLKLMPGDYETSLQCELHVAAITVDKGLGIASEVETVEYDALSYSWGRPELTASIECGGIEFFIPPTAAEGLRQLRSNLHPRWLWCDTICINQEDAREKASQVSHMFTVFVKARKVIGWLGREDPDTSLLVAAVKNALLTGIYEGKGMIAPLPDEPSGPESAKDQELSDIVTRLLARPWFSRTWVSCISDQSSLTSIPQRAPGGSLVLRVLSDRREKSRLPEVIASSVALSCQDSKTLSSPATDLF